MSGKFERSEVPDLVCQVALNGDFSVVGPFQQWRVGVVIGLVAQRQQRAVHQPVALALHQPRPVQRKADRRGVVPQLGRQRYERPGEMNPSQLRGMMTRSRPTWRSRC